MSRTVIVQGDATSSGGKVVTSSPFTDIDGYGVARDGDMATCPLHKGSFPIVTYDPTLVVDGRCVARHGDKLACGCTLIAGKQFRVTTEGGGAPMPASAPVEEEQLASLASALDKAAVCEECLQAAAASGAPMMGR